MVMRGALKARVPPKRGRGEIGRRKTRIRATMIIRLVKIKMENYLAGRLIQLRLMKELILEMVHRLKDDRA